MSVAEAPPDIPTLFDIVFPPLPPYQPHSATSRAAAEAILPRAGTLRRRVLDRIKLAGAYGVTDEQICHAEHLEGSAVRPRRIELLRAGLIKDSGRQRKCHSGRMATVWVAV